MAKSKAIYWTAFFTLIKEKFNCHEILVEYLPSSGLLGAFGPAISVLTHPGQHYSNPKIN